MLLQPVLHNINNVDLFIHVFTYFAHCSLAREQPADLPFDRLLDKAKSHENALAEYQPYQKNRQDSMAFPATVSTSIDAVNISESYRRSLSRTCGRSSLHCNISGCCPASGTQCDKCGHPNHQQCLCYTRTPSRSPSRKVETLILILMQGRKEPISSQKG